VFVVGRVPLKLKLKLTVIGRSVARSEEWSSDEDSLFLDVKQKSESVSSVSRDGRDEEHGLAPVQQAKVRLEVIGGRAVVLRGKGVREDNGRKGVRVKVKAPVGKAEEEICWLRHVKLVDENQRVECSPSRERGAKEKKKEKRRREREDEESEQVGGTTGKRRRSNEEIFLTTLSEVELDKSLYEVEKEQDVFSADMDERVDVLFNEFVNSSQ
jgi:hypothetical protein